MTDAAETSSGKFGPVTIWLHWIVAVLMLVTIVYGLVSGYADTPELTQSTMLVHQSVGTVIMVLAFVRIIARLMSPAPPLPAAMPRYQVMLAHLAHVLLYVTLIAYPVTGYISLAARGRVVSMFGFFDLPRAVPRSLSTAAAADDLHVTLQWALYGLIALHVAAALYHQFIVKDGILLRMWPRRSRADSAGA